MTCQSLQQKQVTEMDMSTFTCDEMFGVYDRHLDSTDNGVDGSLLRLMFIWLRIFTISFPQSRTMPSDSWKAWYIYIYVNIYICILHDIQWNVVFFWVKLILNDGKPFGSWAHKAHNTYPQTLRRFLQGHLGQNAMEIIRGHDVAHDDCELVSVKSWLCT